MFTPASDEEDHRGILTAPTEKMAQNVRRVTRLPRRAVHVPITRVLSENPYSFIGPDAQT